MATIPGVVRSRTSCIVPLLLDHASSVTRSSYSLLARRVLSFTVSLHA